MKKRISKVGARHAGKVIEKPKRGRPAATEKKRNENVKPESDLFGGVSAENIDPQYNSENEV